MSSAHIHPSNPIAQPHNAQPRYPQKKSQPRSLHKTSEAMGANGRGSAKAAPEDQLKKVNKGESQFQPPRTSTTNSPPSQPASTTQRSLPLSHNHDDTRTHKVIMADRGTSMLMLLIILAAIPAIFSALAKMGVSWKGFLGCGVGFCVAISMRIIYINRGFKLPVPARFSRTSTSTTSNLLDGVPAAYFLYVCGSGGHTAEMFELIRQSLAPAPNVHRRYVFTTGDNNSQAAIINFETLVELHYGDNGGTWDAYQVKRARNVHQSLLTTPFTALLSLFSIYEALTTPPKDRNTRRERKLFKYPHVITTNGPGNGVMTAIVARLLKIFFVAPTNCMKLVFIETWAHVETLSLTGKIFHWGRHVGGIVDIFLVQHGRLADTYGYRVFDFITPRRAADETHHE